MFRYHRRLVAEKYNAVLWSRNFAFFITAQRVVNQCKNIPAFYFITRIIKPPENSAFWRTDRNHIIFFYYDALFYALILVFFIIDNKVVMNKKVSECFNIFIACLVFLCKNSLYRKSPYKENCMKRVMTSLSMLIFVLVLNSCEVETKSETDAPPIPKMVFVKGGIIEGEDYPRNS